jgi:hypothetical protein
VEPELDRVVPPPVQGRGEMEVPLRASHDAELAALAELRLHHDARSRRLLDRCRGHTSERCAGAS